MHAAAVSERGDENLGERGEHLVQLGPLRGSRRGAVEQFPVLALLPPLLNIGAGADPLHEGAALIYRRGLHVEVPVLTVPGPYPVSVVPGMVLPTCLPPRLKGWLPVSAVKSLRPSVPARLLRTLPCHLFPAPARVDHAAGRVRHPDDLSTHPHQALEPAAPAPLLLRRPVGPSRRGDLFGDVHRDQQHAGSLVGEPGQAEGEDPVVGVGDVARGSVPLPRPRLDKADRIAGGQDVVEQRAMAVRHRFAE